MHRLHAGVSTLLRERAESHKSNHRIRRWGHTGHPSIHQPICPSTDLSTHPVVLLYISLAVTHDHSRQRHHLIIGNPVVKFYTTGNIRTNLRSTSFDSTSTCVEPAARESGSQQPSHPVRQSASQSVSQSVSQSESVESPVMARSSSPLAPLHSTPLHPCH